MDNIATSEKIKTLRQTTSRELRFSKSLVGGYQPKEVEEYVDGLQANLEQTKSMFYERLEELSSECGILTREKNGLQNRIHEMEEEKTALEAKAQDQDRALAQVKKENVRLNELILEMQREKNSPRETEQNAPKVIPKQKTVPTEEDNRLQVENVSLRKTVSEQNAQIKTANAEIAAKDREIRKLTIAQRDFAMETNKSLYHYRLNLESNLKRAVQSVENLSEMLGQMKSESDAMYEKTRTSLD